MPTTPAEVSADDIFEALRLIGCPTVFVDGDRTPGDDDLPMLIGALTAAVDRLGIARQVPTDLARMRAWAAGYLQSTGAGGPCGARATFDLLCVRLQLFEVLYEGLTTAGPTAALLRACLGAASAWAITGSTAHAVQAGVLDADDPAVIERSRQNVAEAHALLMTAADLDRQVRDALTRIDKP